MVDVFLFVLIWLVHHVIDVSDHHRMLRLDDCDGNSFASVTSSIPPAGFLRNVDPAVFGPSAERFIAGVVEVTFERVFVRYKCVSWYAVTRRGPI